MRNKNAKKKQCFVQCWGRKDSLTMEGKEKQVYCGDHHITSLVSGKQAINNDDDNTDDNDVENVIYIHLYM